MKGISLASLSNHTNNDASTIATPNSINSTFNGSNSTVSTSRKDNKKLSFHQRQTAIFSTETQAEKQPGAIQHLKEIEVLKKASTELINGLNSEKDIIQGSITLLREQVEQENYQTFEDIRLRFQEMRSCLLNGNEDIYAEMRQNEEMISDVRADQMNLNEQIAQLMGQLDMDTLMLGYKDVEENLSYRDNNTVTSYTTSVSQLGMKKGNGMNNCQTPDKSKSNDSTLLSTISKR